MKIIADIETNGLDPDIIWCVVCKDIKTQKMYKFVKDDELEKHKAALSDWLPLSSFKAFSKKVETYIGHNFVTFDAPILNRILGTNIKLSQIEDTLVMSRLANPERFFGHSLRGWGNFLKFPKNPSPPWDYFTVEMALYCEQDIRLNDKVYKILLKELADFSEQSIRVEQQIAHYIDIMCKNGVGFNNEKATKLYAEVKEKSEALEKEIKKHFPTFPALSKTIEAKYKKDKVNSKGEVTKAGELSVVNRRIIPKLGEHHTIIYWKNFSEEAEEALDLFVNTKMYTPHKGNIKPITVLKKTIESFEYTNDIEEITEVKPTLATDERTFSIIEWQEFNPSSHKQVVRLLNNVGWQPFNKTAAHVKAMFEFNKGKITQEDLDKHLELGWKVDRENLNTLPKDAPKEYHKISVYKMVANRETMLRKQYFPSVKNGRIYGDVFTLGAVTNRMTHRNPNLANIVSIATDDNDIPLTGIKGRYGFEMRELFQVNEPDRVLLGTDAEGLELRTMAHDMRDQNFIHIVVNGDSSKGTDVHTNNQRILGLAQRKQAKTFIFAFIYGAGHAKLGSIVGSDARAGGELKGKFFRSLPKLKVLFNNVKNAATASKKIRGLDGRVLHVRKNYAALNTRLQSSGAIICKYWLVNIMREVSRLKLDAKLVLAVHDEYQFDVVKKDALALEKICKEQMIKTGEQLNLRLPLEANVKTGSNWAATH